MLSQKWVCQLPVLLILMRYEIFLSVSTRFVIYWMKIIWSFYESGMERKLRKTYNKTFKFVPGLRPSTGRKNVEYFYAA